VSFAVLSAFAVSAMAHHSLEAEYDFSKTITLSGTLAKVGWQNPHVWIYVDAKDPADGKTAQWAIEMAAAVCMEKAGIAPESFAVGSAVTVRNAPAAKDGTRHTFVGSVSDGNKAVTVHQRNGLAATLELKSVFDRRPAVQPKPSPDPVTHEPTALAMGLGC
jgi:hypothetical protein